MIIEVKVQCDCGTKYKFDVEPLQGCLPSPVHCPGCGVEGTDAANAQLRQKLALLAATPAKTAPIPRASPPAGSASTTLVADPAPVRSTIGGVSPRELPLAGERFAMGTVGAVVAGLVATLAWFFLVKVTGYQIGLAAWGVGLLVGMGARGLGRQGSRRLGAVGAVCAFAAILVGQWLAAPASSGAVPNTLAPGSGVGVLTCLWLSLAAASAWKLGVSGTKG